MSAGLIDPIGAGYTVIPNNVTNLNIPTRAVYVGGAGTLKVDMINGDTITFSGVLAGSLLPLQVRRVYSTGTSATLILALY